jgi:hypothetical protein
MELVASAKVAKKIGRIAQLGERCPYKAEVTGSIPVPPTSDQLAYGEQDNSLNKNDEILERD